MKRNLLLLLVIIALISSQLVQTRIGCLAQSKELKERFDTKAYHPVHCTCDCTSHQAHGKYTIAQNRCLECGHSHDPTPLIIITKIAQTIGKSKNAPSIEHEKTALQHLIDQFNRQNTAIFDK